MIWQYLSLFVAIVAIGLNIYNYVCIHKRPWVMIFWISFWMITVLFYVLVLFTDLPAHFLSSSVRLMQYSMLITWFISHRWQRWKHS